MVDQLMRAYTPDVPRWTTIQSLSEALGFTTFTSQSGLDFFTSQGVSPNFAKEMIEAATRVNYAQDITTIHGLGAAVCMAASGAKQIAGGVSEPSTAVTVGNLFTIR